MSSRRCGVPGLLQWRRAADERVRGIHRDFADALQALNGRCGQCVEAASVQPVVDLSCNVALPQHLALHGVSAVVVETREAEKIAEHAQYFPGGTRLAQRLN